MGKFFVAVLTTPTKRIPINFNSLAVATEAKSESPTTTQSVFAQGFTRNLVTLVL
jgi:hypothetical protein